ncbi:hypothetical protein M5K25_021402 [Dendrobium thyrsiflorum]|uniref:Cytochrome P450 n=1 Tax=Dendrobium thyrsiflorum TaxID=117978 RepID=A0ABD0UJA6_DENTH
MAISLLFLTSTTILPISFLTLLFLFLFLRPSKSSNLPPGPPCFPLLGNLLQLALSRKQLIHYIPDLIPVYGPIFTLRFGSQTHIFITNPELAHEALIQKSQLFASRPAETPIRNIFSCNKFTVNSAFYGPDWRILRRNMVSNILNPTRLKAFDFLRQTAINRFIDQIRAESASNKEISVLRNTRFAVFHILISMCFGLNLHDNEINKIDILMKKVLVTATPQMDDFLPLIKPFFAKKRAEAIKVRKEQIEAIVPLINKRRGILRNPAAHPDAINFSYLDSLLDLQVRNSAPPTDAELVTLCSEFLNGGTDTTATAIEWGIAELIDKPSIQSRIYEEIAAVAGKDARLINENDTEGMVYLQAFVKELLRKHPPAYFTLTHAAVEDGKLGGYDVPKDANLEIYLPAIAEDPRLWKDAGEFKPERFLRGGESADMTGVKEIKMIPFGAGRRACPGMGMGTMHITLLLARMVQEFEWRNPAEKKLNFGSTFVFTVVMERPLRAIAVPRK